MKKMFLLLAALCAGSPLIEAQVISGASNLVATEVPHTTIPYRIEDKGTKLPDIIWGLDLAWISEGNLARGANYAGDLIDIVRLSFQTTYAVENGQLSAAQKAKLDERIGYVKKWTPNAGINLNSDQEAGVIDWYHSSVADPVAVFPPRWAALIAASKDYVESKGMKVVSVSPFNEPDYTPWKQGSMAEMKEICRLFREDPAYVESFKDVILCGGNTLNNDQAAPWYNYCKDYLDEGNTHQLAGDMKTFKSFYQQVVADGKIGVGDELHNTMECMVGSEYGLTKGIWWGTCEHTRSQFMKASRGTRMGYADNESRWTAGAVYRHPDTYREGCPVQGFVGTSERQASATTYRFAALDHDVFYNGQGPAREFIIKTPGFENGGYDTEGKYCRNAEAVFNIQGGEDIMPVIPTEEGTYYIISRCSTQPLAPNSNQAVSGRAMSHMRYTKGYTQQQWVVKPQANDVGGDFTYFTLYNAKDPTLLPDIENWSLEDRGRIILWAGDGGTLEQWYLEYAGDGWFYIRNRHSAMCLEVDPLVNGKPATDQQLSNPGRPVIQGVFTGEKYQQWRLIPASALANVASNSYTALMAAPAAPTALQATPQPGSIRLEWTAPADNDIAQYIVQRSADGLQWNTIHNSVPGTVYIDNTANPATAYYYRVRAVDNFLNRSEPSESITARIAATPACIMQMTGDSLQDATVNGNHCALQGSYLQQTGQVGKAIQLNGGTAKYLQLPATIANHRKLTVATWVNMRAASNWQRVFDFGTDTEHYVFLTFKNSYTSKPRLAIKNGGDEQTLDFPAAWATGKWLHVAVTFGENEVVVYLNGAAVATSTTMTIRPADFRPIFNYIGRSQFDSDPLLRAYIDDFRIYNYTLSADEIAAIYNLTDGIESINDQSSIVNRQSSMDGLLYDLSGRRLSHQPSAISPQLPKGVYILNGKKVYVK